MTEARDALVAHVQQLLIGPVRGPEEEIEGLPTKQYLMGILFPQEAGADSVVEDEEPDAVGTSEGDLVADDPVALAGQWMPSSLGLSCFVAEGADVTCSLWGASYERVEERGRKFRRIAIAEADAPETIDLPEREASVLDGRARIRVSRRPLGAGTLITVTLVNAGMRGAEPDVPPEECLFQVGLRLDTKSGILEYPSVALLSRDPEEQELRLLYRESRTFAIGHGCAVDWWGDRADAKSSIATVLMPKSLVRGVTQKARGDLDTEVLTVARLADDSVPWPELRVQLDGFVRAYEEFAEGERERDDVPEHLEAARERIVERLDVAAGRMRQGIDALGDETVRAAFRLANRTMVMQRERVELVRTLGDEVDRHTDIEMDVAPEGSSFTWYPFQLAFQLLTLASLSDSDHPDRDCVDLIWFPTGGGKTEAYLAVAATEIFLRRLRLREQGGGTAVLTRYTLRLLTTQQFERAAATICAAEHLRRADPAMLGTEPISIGLWVGDDSAPNRFSRANDLFIEQREAESPSNPFQLERCPWCGTPIFPPRGSEDDADYGVYTALDDFRFNCPHEGCPFHELLPVQIVDDGLYATPPTLLLGTVDKFAQLVWSGKGRAFFGDGGRCAPPSLVIQDELHLLSGPLGTTVGVYEAAIEALCTGEGVRPKLVASTATIRRSDEQVRGLFGGRRVALFPPAGVDARDSFFARRDDKDPGRLYVGVMAQSHTQATGMVHLSAALLQGVVEVEMDNVARDGYWTMVAYHNSLRELGRTVTIERDDVPARIEGIAADGSEPRILGDEDVVELTGNVGGTSEALRRMAMTRASGEAISVLACTNMLSVGVDVGRLGLMLVNGQPKTASEYIQATSRVGRGATPGLVVALFTATKPRDRSHYEGFRPFHEALYRHVEPTSVTPWSAPSRARALHAAFVLLMRHLGGLHDDGDAHRFDASDAQAAQVREILLSAVGAADPEELAEAGGNLDRLEQEWMEAIEKADEAGKTLHFRPAGKAVHSLLRRFGERQPGWDTLDSMRSVDRECRVLVRGEDK